MNFLKSVRFTKIADRQSQAMSISSIVAFPSTSNTDTSSTILPEISFTSFDTQRILSWIASVGDSSGGYDSLPNSPIVESSTSVESKAKSGNIFYDENDCVVPPPRMERQNAQCGNCYSFDVLPRNKFYDEDDCIVLPPPMVRQDAQGGDRYSVDFLPGNEQSESLISPRSETHNSQPVGGSSALLSPRLEQQLRQSRFGPFFVMPPRLERQHAQCGNRCSVDSLRGNEQSESVTVAPTRLETQNSQPVGGSGALLSPRLEQQLRQSRFGPFFVMPPRLERQHAQCGNRCSVDSLRGNEQSESVTVAPTRLETQNSQPVGGSGALLSPRLEQQLRQSRFGPFFVMPPRLERQDAQCGNRCSVDSLRGNEQSESVTVAPTRLETQNSLPVGGSSALLSPRLEQKIQSRFGPFFVMPPRLERQNARSGEGLGLVVSTSRVGRVSVAGRRLASGVSDSTGGGRAEGMRRRLEEERIADANFGQTPISPLDTLSPRITSSRLSPPTTFRLNPMPVGLPAGSNSIMRSCSCAPSIPSPVRHDPSTKQAHLHLKRSVSEPQLQTRARMQPQILF